MAKTILEKINAGREFRTITLSNIELREGGENEYVVDGYATTFGDAYTLYKYDGYEVREIIDAHAFDNCDMSDVIMQYDHEGTVFARTRNSTLKNTIDARGLRIWAYLGGTEAGRRLYEEIKGGYIDRMSFAFRVKSDKREEVEDHAANKITVTRTIVEIEKLYDVSAVSIPANDATTISARSYGEGVIAELTEESRKCRENLNLIKILCEV